MRPFRILIALLLCVCLPASLLAGCRRESAKPETAQTTDPSASTQTEPGTDMPETDAPGTEAPTEPPGTEAPTEQPETSELPAEPEKNLHPISLKTAFRWPDAPNEDLTEDSVAFYRLDEEGSPWAEILPIEELMTYAETALPIPRTHFFDNELPEHMELFISALTYALNNGCPKFCFASAELTESDIDGLPSVFLVNGQPPSSITVKSFDLEDGRALRYIQVSFGFLMKKTVANHFVEGLKTARQIVAEIPEDYTDYQKALYLYSYLTENVRYFEGDEAADYYNGDWTLIYDSLVTHETVCSGYTETLYYLFNLAGLDCFTVSGDIKGNLKASGHIWNVAKLDGQYYMFDATWDERMPAAMYQFFGVSWEDMNLYYPRILYTASSDYCPECTVSLLPPMAPNLFDDVDLFREGYMVCRMHADLLTEPFYTAVFANPDIDYLITAEELDDSWFRSTLHYQESIDALQEALDAGELTEFCLSKVTREHEGTLDYRIDSGLLRLTEIKTEGNRAVAVICYIDELGNLEQTFEVPID